MASLKTNSPQLATAFLLGLLMLSSVLLGVSPLDLPRAISGSFSFLERAFPADFQNLDSYLSLLIDSIAIAFVSTIAGFFLSIPITFLSVQTSGVFGLFRYPARFLTALIRAVPDLAIALFAVVLIGIGSFAGYVALSIASTAMFARLFTIELDGMSKASIDSFQSLGLSRTHLFSVLFFTKLAPKVLSTVVYRFDINLRSASVIGLVGAGGIGLALKTRLGQLDYSGAVVVIGLIAVIVLVSELISNRLKLAFLPKARAQQAAKNSNYFAGWIALATVFIAFIFTSMQLSRTQPDRNSSIEIESILVDFLSPDFSNINGLLVGLTESLLMTSFAGISGVSLGLLLGISGSVNITRNRPASALLKLVITLIRSIPPLVYGLLAVTVVGLGPKAGSYGLMLVAISISAKLTLDTLESRDQKPEKALFAIGTGFWRRVVATVFPANGRVLRANSIFVTDIILRYSIVFGVIGAGGLGSELLLAMNILDFQTVSAIAIMFLIPVMMLDWVADRESKTNPANHNRA